MSLKRTYDMLLSDPEQNAEAHEEIIAYEASLLAVINSYADQLAPLKSPLEQRKAFVFRDPLRFHNPTRYNSSIHHWVLRYTSEQVFTDWNRIRRYLVDEFGSAIKLGGADSCWLHKGWVDEPDNKKTFSHGVSKSFGFRSSERIRNSYTNDLFRVTFQLGTWSKIVRGLTDEEKVGLIFGTKELDGSFSGYSGSIDSWDLSHLCGNWPCINPQHHVHETHSVNIDRNSCHRLGVCSKEHEPECIVRIKLSSEILRYGLPQSHDSRYRSENPSEEEYWKYLGLEMTPAEFSKVPRVARWVFHPNSIHHEYKRSEFKYRSKAIERLDLY